YFFFFSSRRRHTRFSRDWSSDVCSSDLVARECRQTINPTSRAQSTVNDGSLHEVLDKLLITLGNSGRGVKMAQVLWPNRRELTRSEERRVGKEWSSRWWEGQSKKDKYRN